MMSAVGWLVLKQHNSTLKSSKKCNSKDGAELSMMGKQHKA